MESREVSSKVNNYTKKLNPTPRNPNFYAALTCDEDDEETIVSSNKS